MNLQYQVESNNGINSEYFKSLMDPVKSMPYYSQLCNEFQALNSLKNQLTESQQIFEKHENFGEEDQHLRANAHSINLDVLKGHKYEIRHHPTQDGAESNYEYICRYDNCGKIFNKTYNLVYHFRVHTNEKPFECKFCHKKFSQKGNLGRHLERHKTDTVEERKVYNCEA